MNYKFVIDFCKTYYEATYQPISVYTKEKEALYTSFSFQNNLDLNDAVVLSALKEADIPYSMTLGNSVYYGIVFHQKLECYLVLGPIIHTGASKESIRQFIRQGNFPFEYTDEINVFMSGLPSIPWHQFLNILLFLHHSINGEKIDKNAFLQSYTNKEVQAIPLKHAQLTYESKENQTLHTTHKFEQAMLKLIEQGNLGALEDLFEHTSMMHEGILADSPLRQAKNTFIGLASVVGKVAGINGGLDVEEAYSLIDTYIQACERMHSIEQISKLHYQLIIDFTKRIAQHQIPSNISKLTFDCIQFISSHTNAPISIEDVAAHVGKSRSFMVDVFKKDTGISIGKYILVRKLEEAQYLLKYTEKTILDISNYLCFSSQAYFSTAFKREFGMTPGTFRSKIE